MGKQAGKYADISYEGDDARVYRLVRKNNRSG